MFSFGLKIVPPDLAWCGWCTQLRGIILSLLYVLLNIYVINAVKSIRSIKYITHSFWKFFSHCHIVCPPPTSQWNRTIFSKNVILWFLKEGDFDFHQTGLHLHPVWLYFKLKTYDTTIPWLRILHLLSTLCPIPQSSNINSQLICQPFHYNRGSILSTQLFLLQPVKYCYLFTLRQTSVLRLKLSPRHSQMSRTLCN